MFLCPASVSRVLFRRTMGMGAGLVVWERPQEDASLENWSKNMGDGDRGNRDFVIERPYRLKKKERGTEPLTVNWE